MYKSSNNKSLGKLVGLTKLGMDVMNSMWCMSLIMLIALSFSSCRESSTDLYDESMIPAFTETPSKQFDRIWNGINERYVYWNIDPTDWDAVYEKYMPIFKDLDYSENVTDSTLQSLYDGICGSLVDHHFNLFVTNKNYTVSCSPGQKEVESRSYYHAQAHSYDYENVYTSLKEKNEITDYTYYEKDSLTYAVSFLIDNEIAYLHSSKFDFSSLITKEEKGTISKKDSQKLSVLRNFQNIVLRSNIKGVILDVRDNVGGDMQDLKETFGYLIEEDLHIGDVRYKSGLGRLDYAGWIPFYAHPNSQHISKDIPIVCLVNIHSASLAENIALAVKELPNGCVIGERTYGAFGPLFNEASDFPYTYSGTFGDYGTWSLLDLSSVDLSSGILVTMASVEHRAVNGQFCEGKGVSPNIEVMFNLPEFRNGNDVELNRAIKYINEK